jgi:hypothetical protein
MAFTTPGTAVAGDVLTAAFWNSNVRDNLNDHETRIVAAPQTIQTITLSGTGSITFSSIPQTYTHLQLFYRIKVAKAVGPHGLVIRFEGDSSANYSFNYIQTNNTTVTGGTTIGSTIPIVGVVPGAGATAGYFGTGIITISNYRDTSYQKRWNVSSSFMDTTAASSYVRQSGGLWTSTSAITQITLHDDSGTNSHLTGSTATLIGIP